MQITHPTTPPVSPTARTDAGSFSILIHWYLTHMSSFSVSEIEVNRGHTPVPSKLPPAAVANKSSIPFHEAVINVANQGVY